jgi:hypothetical protein
MFLSKIWFILVGLLAGVAVTAAFVAPRPADRRIEQLEGQRLDRAQYAAEQMLKTDARRWIDYVAKLGRDATLAESLESATRGAGEPRVLHDTVRGRLKALVPDRAGIGIESLIAVDGKGRVVARVGDDEGEFGESIAGAEVVADALRGFVSDDVWGASNRLRRVGAAPVLSKGRDRVVGALVIAVETGKRMAEMWKRNLGVDVAVVLGSNVTSATQPEAMLNGLPELVAQRANEIAEHKRTRALPFQMGDERFLVVAAPFVGEASEQRAYYVLLNKKAPVSNPWALLSATSLDDLSWGKFPWFSLAGGLVVLIGVGLALQRVEVEGPLRRLRAEVQALARNEIQKIGDTRYGGKLGGIARDINATVERFTHAPSPKSETAKKDIGSILGDASANGKSFELPRSTPAAPPDPAAVAASLFGAPKPGTVVPVAPLSVSIPAASAAPVGPLSVSLPSAPASPESAQSTAPSAVPMPAIFADAARSAGLTTGGSAALAGAASGASPDADAVTAELPLEREEVHFRQVFDQYLALRAKCGESITAVTMEKFREKLISNREQLVNKYGCRTARFSVYVKDGKAAIRATPVRD